MYARTNARGRRRRTAVLAATTGVALGVALLAPPAFGGAAGSAGPTQDPQPTATTTSLLQSEEPQVTTERGLALAGSGTLEGRRVFVEIYGNDTYGSQATVVVEQRGGPDLAAHTELATDDLLDGDVELDLPLARSTRGGEAPTREHAQVSGRWVATGETSHIDEEYEDAGFRIRTTGTNTRLDAQVVVVVAGQVVPLQMHDTFAFDLTVTRTPM